MGDKPDKFIWLDAVAAFDAINKPGLRVAVGLFNFYNWNIGFAWPTRIAMARRLAMSERDVSLGVESLKRCRALAVIQFGELPPFIREQINAVNGREKDERSHVYRLDIEWARQVIAAAHISAEPESRWL